MKYKSSLLKITVKANLHMPINHADLHQFDEERDIRGTSRARVTRPSVLEYRARLVFLRSSSQIIEQNRD